ncbi:MAG TPA: S8 family serine peptidase, partial [Pirellulales bacterium]
MLRFEIMERRDLLSLVGSPDEPGGSLVGPILPSSLAAGMPGSQEVRPTFITADQEGDVAQDGSLGPVGKTPAQIRQAYAVNQITLDGGAIQGDGTGQTIAIVDAYDDPTISADLNNFDQTFGLAAPPSFKKVDQDGGTNYPSVDTLDAPGDTWEVEEALDVEWAHALAPGANILLVEASVTASGPDLDDLMAAAEYAASVPGVSVVSMSWGTSEFSSEAQFDSDFVTPAGHSGVTFVASTGDQGAPGEYPAYSPNVLAVGGTSL